MPRRLGPRRMPCRKIRVIAWPGTEPWLLHADQVRRLACLLSRDVTIEYVPRSQVAQVWARDHGGRPMPVAKYAFRAYSRGTKAVLFVDETETPASATWLLLHELGHIELPNANLLYSSFRYIPKPPGYLSSDEAHEAHPEEQLANQVATHTMPLLGLPRKSLDRLWWRRRVRALQRRHAQSRRVRALRRRRHAA